MSGGTAPLDVLLVSPWERRPGASGVISACRNLARGLARSDEIGTLAVLSLSDSAGRDDTEPGVRVEFVKRQQRLALLTEGWPDYLRVSAWLRQSGLRPDVVHGQGFAGEGRVAVRLARKLGVPSVVTVHGMVDKEASLYSDTLRAFLAKRVMKQTLGAASGVVFVSPYRSQELVAGPATVGRVIENAIADSFFAPATRARSETILYVGFIGRRKRLGDVVEALARVRDRVPGARLRVAGPVQEAPYDEQVRARVAALGLDDAVEFLGPLEERALRDEYTRAGVLVLPSEEENAPQVIAEAMASGVPVVATDVGGVAWMVSDGVGGFVVPAGDVSALGDRLVRVLGDDAVWREMSRAARAEAERFRADRVAAETAGLYRHLIARGGSPR
jgi:glycosyltransferase involved in cell wall biosynthesis